MVIEHNDIHREISRLTSLVERPSHYTGHPSGVECIQITEHMNFCRGNAIKYVWRAGEKGNEIEDLMKARWYIDREISRLTAMRAEEASVAPDEERETPQEIALREAYAAGRDAEAERQWKENRNGSF